MMSSQPTSGTVSQIHPQKTLRGIVRAVNSGDSIVIQEVDTERGQLLIKQEFLLSAIACPRLGKPARPDKPATEDEPFAWESREFLRKKCIGKRVSYVVDYSTPNGKPYITAYLVDDIDNSINNQMIESGWATLYKSKKQDPVLLALENAAASKELGVHGKVLKDQIKTNHTVNNLELFDKLKGKQLHAIVENIRNLTNFKVVIQPSLHIINVQLSGVQVKKDINESILVDGENLINNNVLNRDVTLTLDTFDKQSTLFGSVNCAGRDIAEVLLRNGFGAFVGWSAASRSAADQTSLKDAEAMAKGQRLRIWSGFTAPAPGSSTSTSTSSSESSTSYPEEITGKVIEIDNSGQVTIQIASPKKDIKVSMASIRIPVILRSSNENDAKMDKEARFERYWALEAKEWLRKRLIGATVTAKLEFVRPAINRAEVNLTEKPFYTVFNGKSNISVGLVEAGLAKVNEHKGADNRAVDYESLILAENKAKKKNSGLHSNKDSCPKLNINDVSTDDSNLKAKASKLLPHIKGGVNSAVIDYVFSAQRFKVYIPKESCMINFSLTNVRAPKRGENAEMDELSNLALLFSRENLHQRDVQVQIDDVDKGGNFLGTLFFNTKNYAITLVDNGFATVNDPYKRSPDHKSLEDAENRAKNKRLNLWRNYDPEAERRAQEEADRQDQERLAKEKAESQKEVVISSIISPTEVFVRNVNQQNTDLEELLQKLSIDANASSTSSFAPKVGDVVNCKYTDNKWYRAKIVNAQSPKFYVQFYDYGNSSATTIDNLRPLSGKFENVQPLSYYVQLAYVKPTSNEDRNEDAIIHMEDVFLGSTVTLQVQYKDENGKNMVTLEDSQGILNGELLREGLVKFDKNSRKGGYYAEMQSEETTAKTKRNGIWQFGDAGSDDEDDFGSRRGGRRTGKK